MQWIEDIVYPCERCKKNEAWVYLISRNMSVCYSCDTMLNYLCVDK